MPRRTESNRRPRREKTPMVATGRRSRHLQGVEEIDFRDINLLRKFVTQQGKIMPARLTGATALQQRQIAREVRKARIMGLLP